MAIGVEHLRPFRHFLLNPFVSFRCLCHAPKNVATIEANLSEPALFNWINVNCDVLCQLVSLDLYPLSLVYNDAILRLTAPDFKADNPGIKIKALPLLAFVEESATCLIRVHVISKLYLSAHTQSMSFPVLSKVRSVRTRRHTSRTWQPLRNCIDIYTIPWRCQFHILVHTSESRLSPNQISQNEVSSTTIYV